MKIAIGRCQICGDKIHMTKHYKWQHDSREKKEHSAVLSEHTYLFVLDIKANK